MERNSNSAESRVAETESTRWSRTSRPSSSRSDYDDWN